MTKGRVKRVSGPTYCDGDWKNQVDLYLRNMAKYKVSELNRRDQHLFLGVRNHLNVCERCERGYQYGKLSLLTKDAESEEVSIGTLEDEGRSIQENEQWLERKLGITR